MADSPISFAKGKIIKSIEMSINDLERYGNFKTINKFNIYFEEETKSLELMAEGECCSISWFKFPTDIQNIVGKKIDRIEHNDSVELPKSNEDEVIRNIPIKIIFEDGAEPYEFNILNSSNGYYNGWLEVSLKN